MTTTLPPHSYVIWLTEAEVAVLEAQSRRFGNSPTILVERIVRGWIAHGDALLATSPPFRGEPVKSLVMRSTPAEDV